MLTAIILAGGESRRIKQYKPLVKLCGKPLIKHVLEKIINHVDKIIISIGEENHREKLSSFLKTTDIVYVVDHLRKGPITGIYTSISMVETNQVLILPCDTPFISWKTINNLLRELIPPYEAVVYKWRNNYLEPLISVLNTRSLRKVLEHMISNNMFSAHRIYDYLITKYLVIEETISDPYKEFFNINTLEDLIYAEKLCLT